MRSSRGDHAGGQRVVEAERVADRQHVLTDQKVAAAAERDRGRGLVRHLYPQHRQVVFRTGAHQFGGKATLVREPHLSAAGACDHVEVGDHMALLVPQKARAGAARHFADVHGERIDHAIERRDVDHRRTHPPEGFDRGILFGGEGSARRDTARRGLLGRCAVAAERDQRCDQRGCGKTQPGGAGRLPVPSQRHSPVIGPSGQPIGW